MMRCRASRSRLVWSSVVLSEKNCPITGFSVLVTPGETATFSVGCTIALILNAS